MFIVINAKDRLLRAQMQSRFCRTPSFSMVPADVPARNVCWFADSPAGCYGPCPSIRKRAFRSVVCRLLRTERGWRDKALQPAPKGNSATSQQAKLPDRGVREMQVPTGCLGSRLRCSRIPRLQQAAAGQTGRSRCCVCWQRRAQGATTVRNSGVSQLKLS